MRANRKHGLTLMETLAAIAVMTLVLSAGYATVRDGLKLQAVVSAESDRVTARCALAEQLTADFRANRRVQHTEAGRFAVTRADGSVVEYTAEKHRIVRSVAGEAKSDRIFDAGLVEVSFPGRRARSSDTAAAIRLKFDDSELVVGR